jgi:hypothetical protein
LERKESMMTSITRKALAEAKRVAEKESLITRKLVLDEVKRIELDQLELIKVIQVQLKLKETNDQNKGG